MQNPYSYSQSTKPVSFDPRIEIPISHVAQTDQSIVRITRSCWMGFHRNHFHPSLTQYRLNYSEFNDLIEELEKEVSSFSYIKCWYIIIVLNIMISSILFVVGLFVEPGETTKNQKEYEEYSSQGLGCILSSLAFAVLGTAIFAGIIAYLLRKYEFLLKKKIQLKNTLKSEKGSFYVRNIQISIGNYCNFIEIKCLPISSEDFYRLQYENYQNQISKEEFEKLEKSKK